MFGVSLGEITVILLVALICIKPEDIPIYVGIYKKFLRKFKRLRQEVKDNIEETLEIKKYTEEINEKIKTIVGEDGKDYIAYDLPEDFFLDNEIHSSKNAKEEK